MDDKQKSRIGARVRSIRQQAGLTQDHFAQLIHVSRAHVQNIETGQFRPRLEALTRIAHVMHVNLDWLLTGSDLPTEAHHVDAGRNVLMAESGKAYEVMRQAIERASR